MSFSGHAMKALLLQFLILALTLLLFCPAAAAVGAEDYVSAAGENLDFSYYPFPNFVIVFAEPEEGGTVEGRGEFPYEINTTVKATPAEGYYFINWTENGREVSRDREYTFKVTEDRFLTANFAAEEYPPPEIIPGDVNGDGVIDIKDVSLVMRHILGIQKLGESGKEAADVNGDGKVDIIDTTLIMRRALDIIDSFPVEGSD